MEQFGNIEKRIKRQVLGKTRSFFVSTPPGMERYCLGELLALGLSAEDAKTTMGGVVFRGRVHTCYLANLRLRVANRILMRVATFRATNFRQLEKKLANVPWELYLNRGIAHDIKVTCRLSRLYHSDAIAARCREKVEERWQLAGRPQKDPSIPPRFVQQIFVRVVHDEVTISLDSSGALLHKRGLKTQGGKAPLRETIAAGILTLSGFDGRKPLLDPMCGTGTFSLEGAMMANRIPAGWYRSFAFMQWPCFKPSRWKHIRREAEKRITSSPEPLIFASDKDERNCQRLERVVQENALTGAISVVQKDFFDLHAKGLGLGREKQSEGLVVINPPYGRRLGDRKESTKLFVEIVRKLHRDFLGWRVALIVPHEKLVDRIPFKVRAHALFHGGLHMTLVSGIISAC